MYGADGWSAVVLLVRFGELALKSRFVRRQLRDRLVANIQDMFAAAGRECITEADEARVYVHTSDVEKARRVLGRVFGIVSVSPAREVRADLESIRALALQEATMALSPGHSFALRVRRTGSHPFTSQDLARDIGATVLQSLQGVHVDLSRPDVEIHIEVRQNRAFVFRDFWSGPGGLPLGSQGRALAVVDDEEGMVAAWLGMKRGCRVVVASQSDETWVEPLRQWDTHLKVLDLRATDRIPELCRVARAEAVFLGTRWASFDPTRRQGLSVPIFDPVIGLTQEEIGNLADRIRSA